MISCVWYYFTVPVMMLMIAIATLFYAVYRAQLNQENQTARAAGFEMLKTLNQLQMTIDWHHYTPETAPNYLDGWSHILLVDDLAGYIDQDVVIKAKGLHQVWQKNFEQLHSDKSNQELTEAINSTRTSLKKAIQNLH